jgi:hypothetical protein
MSTVTTIEVVDLLTIRECIEILVDRRTGRDRTPTLPPAVVDYLGATHVMRTLLGSAGCAPRYPLTLRSP